MILVFVTGVSKINTFHLYIRFSTFCTCKFVTRFGDQVFMFAILLLHMFSLAAILAQAAIS